MIAYERALDLSHHWVRHFCERAPPQYRLVMLEQQHEQEHVFSRAPTTMHIQFKYAGPGAANAHAQGGAIPAGSSSSSDPTSSSQPPLINPSSPQPSSRRRRPPANPSSPIPK